AGVVRLYPASRNGAMKRDRVTPGIRLAVFRRDAGCLAPQLGGSMMDCWGRLTIEHVKDSLRLGKRAPSDEQHLVTLCSGHTEPGMRAGYAWNLDKRNRALVREYLAKLYGVAP